MDTTSFDPFCSFSFFLEIRPQKIQELSKAFQKVRKEWREEDKKKSSLLEGGGPKFPNRFGNLTRGSIPQPS